MKYVANKEKLVDIQWDNTFRRESLKSSKKARYKPSRQRAYYQALALSLTFEILSKIGHVPIKAVERRYYVDCCEAKQATFLSLERGGRSNVIDNYDFLQYFPNLTALGVGTTTVEVIDLSRQKKLEKLNISNASWLKKIILAEGCKPEISGKDDVADRV